MLGAAFEHMREEMADIVKELLLRETTINGNDVGRKNKTLLNRTD
jgi:hypothetical protein